MKINRYKLKDNITIEHLKNIGAREGGNWISEDAKYFLDKIIYDKKNKFEYSINISFSNDLTKWNDFDNVLILDEDFGQPYTPFYGDNYGKDITNFQVLENVIKEYNIYMNQLEIFERVE